MTWPMQHHDPMFYVRYTVANAGKAGHNEHGVPLHANYGIRHDAHYYAYFRATFM